MTASLPSFLIIGAARAGTTSLHRWLAQHPQLCMSAVKEPNHFCYDASGRPLVALDRRILVKSVPSRAAYERLFRPTPATRAIGEASPLYLYVRETPKLVAAALPEVRVVAVLRDPVSRAYSHFCYLDAGSPDGLPGRFRAAVEAERGLGDTPYRPGTHLLRLGRYAEQVARWRAALGHERVLVLRHDDLVADPVGALRQVCAHIGVEHDSGIDTTVGVNPSGVLARRGPRLLRRAMRPAQPYLRAGLPRGFADRLVAARDAARRRTLSPAPRPEAELRADLIATYYAGTLDSLERDLDWDLFAWRR
jgi:hypothetical protein